MPQRKLDSLQVLRGFAAIAVVADHAFRAVTVNRPPSILLPAPLLLRHDRLVEIGAFGVDLFFVLSGFLMIFISRPYVVGSRPVADFIAHRLIRIWPLYALVTAIQCLLYLRVAEKTGVLPLDLTPLRLLSFVFVPSFDDRHLLQPIIGPGWTLNYEMLFYACFAIALLVARKNLLPAVAAMLGGLFVLGLLLPGGSVAGSFLSNAILFEFVLGAVIADAYLNERLPGLHPGWWVAGGLLLLAACTYWPGDGPYRIFTRGIPAAVLFIGMLGLNGRVAWPKLLTLLGNASYSIYLTHIFVVYQVTDRMLRLCIAHHLAAIAAELTALAGIIIAVACGVAVYVVIEKPLLSTCRRLYASALVRQPA